MKKHFVIKKQKKDKIQKNYYIRIKHPPVFIVEPPQRVGSMEFFRFPIKLEPQKPFTYELFTTDKVYSSVI